VALAPVLITSELNKGAICTLFFSMSLFLLAALLSLDGRITTTHKVIAGQPSCFFWSASCAALLRPGSALPNYLQQAAGNGDSCCPLAVDSFSAGLHIYEIGPASMDRRS
jgi:hypothetical protein